MNPLLSQRDSLVSAEVHLNKMLRQAAIGESEVRDKLGKKKKRTDNKFLSCRSARAGYP